MSVTAEPEEAVGSVAGHVIKLVHAHATPVGTCPLADALSLDVGFTSSHAIPHARWKVRPSLLPIVHATSCFNRGWRLYMHAHA